MLSLNQTTSFLYVFAQKQIGTAARHKDKDSGACAVSIKTIIYGCRCYNDV